MNVIARLEYELAYYHYTTRTLLQKGNLGITKNCRGITLTAIVAKAYNTLFLTLSDQKSKDLKEKSEQLSEKSIHNLSDSQYSPNHGSTCKQSWGNTTVRRFLHTQMKDEENISTQETVTAIMLCKNTNAVVHLLDEDTDFFDIVAGVLQGYTRAPYQFIICLDYVRWTSIGLIKGKKQTISCRSSIESRLRRRSSAFCEYTCASRIFTAQVGADRSRLRSLR